MNARVAEPAQSLLANPILGNGEASQQMIMEFAKVAKKTEKESVIDETKQQNLAVAALSKVDKAVETIGNSEKKSLGESDSTTKTAMEAALQKLKDVSATLHRGTKTMHTKERLERMVEESRTLKHQAHGDPMLGESLTPEEAEQHIQDAAVASAAAGQGRPRAGGSQRCSCERRSRLHSEDRRGCHGDALAHWDQHIEGSQAEPCRNREDGDQQAAEAGDCCG